MASVSFGHLHEPEDDVVHYHHDQTLTLGSLPNWSHDLPYQDDGGFSLPGALVINGPDLFDRRENQVNFVTDLFHQRVEESQVVSNTSTPNNNTNSGKDSGNSVSNDDEINAVDLLSDAFTESGLDLIEGNHELDLGLVLGFDSMDTRENDVEIHIGVGDDEDDDFFMESRVYGMSASEAACNFRGIRVVGFRSDSDDDEENENDNRALTIDLTSGDDYGIDDHINDRYNIDADDDDVGVSIRLCWDSLQLEDHRETNEEFEWEEVDGRVDESEVLSVFVDGDDDENSFSLSVSPIVAPEDVVSFERSAGLDTMGWQVLLNANNLETNPDMDENAEPLSPDLDNFIYTAEYEMLIRQFAENENAYIWRSPASKSIVESLPSVFVTQEDVANNNVLCAICKDEISLGEKMKQLPCAHRYHGECIITWLGIRNTCPMCRQELPTDDADYERRRSPSTGGAS